MHPRKFAAKAIFGATLRTSCYPRDLTLGEGESCPKTHSPAYIMTLLNHLIVCCLGQTVLCSFSEAALALVGGESPPVLTPQATQSQFKLRECGLFKWKADRLDILTTRVVVSHYKYFTKALPPFRQNHTTVLMRP